jgi:hypothetical protein
MERLFRQLVYVLLFLVGPLCLGQGVTIRVVNANDLRPLKKQKVSVTLGYDKRDPHPAKYNTNIALETDANGEAQFRLPEPFPEHFSAQIQMDWGHWDCSCSALADTQEVIQRGLVEFSAKGKKPKTLIKARPGEVIFVARPLSFIERLLYPLLKD